MNIFLHHRDLRLDDNTTLIKMSNDLHNSIIPIFIFTPEQIDPMINKYFSNNLVQFMCQSLIELKQEYGGNMHFYYGDTVSILKKLHKKFIIKNLGFNLDYSPYAKERYNIITKWAKKNNINIYSEEDMLLVNIMNGQTLSKSSNEPYKVFTPFMNYLKNTYKIDKPQGKYIKVKKFNDKINDELLNNDLKKFYTTNENLNVPPGRKNAKKRLLLVRNQDKYNELRNCLSYETTLLSSYINLGLLSIREVYYHVLDKLGSKNDIIKELYWRDFYYNILYYYPHVVGNSFKKNYDNIKWSQSKENFDKWTKGNTGFPIVDACMRQMNTTGFMHNRGRMIVASFLTKDLLIDWRLGEKYFATQLEDYNISANNGGWQWASGSGTDAQPYFRIFNPWTQSKRFDPNCEYIKKWIVELKDVENNVIHNWYKYYDKKEYQNINYPKPILDHNQARKETLKLYKKYL